MRHVDEALPPGNKELGPAMAIKFRPGVPWTSGSAEPKTMNSSLVLLQPKMITKLLKSVLHLV